MSLPIRMRLRNFHLLLFSLLLFSAADVMGNTSEGGQCVPPRVQYKVPAAGHYHRMHPSGNYYIYTEDRNSYVVDVTNQATPVTYRSSAREEAYPVESASGGWDLIAAPIDGGARGPKGGMQYYRFRDLASSKSASAKPTYTDSSHGEYYLSSAELPGSNRQTKQVRTLLFSDRSYRDYKFEMSEDGSVKKATPGPVKSLCENLMPVPREPTQDQRSRADALSRRFREVTGGSGLDVAAAKAVVDEIFALEKEMYSHYGEGYAATRKSRNLVSIDLAVARAAVNAFQPYQDALKKLNEAQQKYRRQRNLIEDPIRQAADAELNRLQQAYRAARDQATRSRIEAEYNVIDRQIAGAVNAAISANEEVRQSQQEVATADSLRSALETAGPMKEVRDLERKMRIFEEDLSAMTARNIANPILSKDGTHVAGSVGGRLTVYKINENGSCDLVLKTSYRGSKVSFSYPKQGENLKITFTAESGAPNYRMQAYTVDTKTGTAEVISENGDNPYYPGFLLDGRVMYRSNMGMVVVDPEAKQGRKCLAEIRSNTKTTKDGKTKK